MSDKLWKIQTQGCWVRSVNASSVLSHHPTPEIFMESDPGLKKRVLKRVLLEVVERKLETWQKTGNLSIYFCESPRWGRVGRGVEVATRFASTAICLSKEEPIMFEKNLKLSIVARKCSGNSFAWFLKIFKDCHGKPGIFRFKSILS